MELLHVLWNTTACTSCHKLYFADEISFSCAIVDEVLMKLSLHKKDDYIKSNMGHAVWNFNILAYSSYYMYVSPDFYHPLVSVSIVLGRVIYLVSPSRADITLWT